MKILRICPSFPEKEVGGGLEPHIYNLSVAQRKLGDEIIVICGGDRNGELVGNGFKIHKFKTERPFLLKTGKRILEKVPEIIKKENPDIIHIHNPIVPLSKPLPKPIIFTIHDSVVSYKVYRKKILKYLKSYWEFFRASKKIAKNCSAVVSVSSSGRMELIEQLGVDDKKTFYIPSGVDIKWFRPGAKNKKTTILSAGRFVKKKGFIFLIRAMKEIVDKYPAAVLILLGGREDDEEYGHIRSEIKKLGLDNNVQIKAVPHKEMEKFYRNCSVYVQPSFAEGLPKTVLEAMACEKPIIATNIDGHRDAVRNNENGFLIEPGNSDALAEKIIYLLKNKGEAKLFGKKGLETVKKEFTWDQAAKKYERLYNELIKKS